MKLYELYERDITRHINPAVVVSEMKEEFINQEIGEYVFTKEIVENIYKFLNAISNKKEGKTGVWISGYYGSGKSHFIKYLFYFLNKRTREMAFDRLKEDGTSLVDDFSDATLSNFQLIQNKLENMEVQETIFNIDAVSGSSKNNGVITRILMNQLNRTRGYNGTNISVALLIEKHLDQRGLFGSFKKKIKEKIGEEWEDAKVKDFIRLKLAQVIEIASEFDPDIDKESLREAIKKDENYSIDALIYELKEYTASKGENFRFVYLMDEVSQYVGTNTDVLLNLQTVIDEMGSKIGNKVWLVCTAQQDLSDLVHNTENKRVEFGKIMGRFETMISLDSQDATVITQKRILEKRLEAMPAMEGFYQKNKSAIENQFIFEHDLYKNFSDKNEFRLAYPFVPYQFRLISDVFHSFSQVGFVGEGVKNNERSILGIVHYTARQQKDKELGYFISFDDFFNDQLTNNLTYPANNILNRAFKIEFDSEEVAFAHRVIKVLFMISNLMEAQSVNFPATVENIALLLIDNLRTVKMDLRKQVQKILDRLVEKNIVQVSEGKYRFLDDEGIKIAAGISKEETNLNDRLTFFYDQFIKEVLRPDAAVNIGNKTVKVQLWIDDRAMTTAGSFNIKFVLFDKMDLSQRCLNVPGTELDVNIDQWYYSDRDFMEKFSKACKTHKYLSENHSTATGSRLQKLDEFASNNNVLLKGLQERFKARFDQISFISSQNLVRGEELSATGSAQRYKEMVDFHVKNVYKHHALSDGFAQNNAALKEAIDKGLVIQSFDKELNKAEEEVDNKILLFGNEMGLSDLVSQFEKPPYGWKDIAILHIVFNLANKGRRSIYYQNDQLDLRDYFERAINANSRRAIQIKPVKTISQDLIIAFKRAVQDVFIDIPLPSGMKDAKQLSDTFKKHLEEKLKTANALREEFAGYPFNRHFKDYHLKLKDLYEIRSEEKLMQAVVEEKEDLKQKRDLFVSVMSFTKDYFEEYKRIKEYIHQQQPNFSKLSEDLQDRVEDVNTYFRTDDQPGDQYPTIRKIYKKLKEAVSTRLEELRNIVLKEYEGIFDFLEARKEELKIEKEYLIPDRATILKGIRQSGNLLELENRRLKTETFRSTNLMKLEEEYGKTKAAEKGEEYVKPYEMRLMDYVSAATLNSPDEVDALIDRLRNKLMVELKKNGKIFLK